MTKHYLNVCRRLEKADIVLKNASIINVFTKEIVTGDLALCNDKIVGIGSYSGYQEIDLKGKYIAPGFIDSHVHIESSMISPYEFAKVVATFGTTTLIADPHEIANVSGISGIQYMLDKSQNAPISIFYMLPSCVPTTMMESSGAVLEADTLHMLINHPNVLGLGEMMNFPSVILGDQIIMDKINIATNKIIDGHAPGLHGYDLSAYALAGIHTDHECSTIEEVIERLRLGMVVQIRKGTAANNLKDLISGLITHKLPLEHCIFCTDDKHLEHIFSDGHINSNIRESIALGISPMEALRMATLYPAQIYQLKHKGSLAPGYDADLVVLDDFETMKISKVMALGKWVYDKKQPNTLIEQPTQQRYSKETQILNTVNLMPIRASDLTLPLRHPRAHIMDLIEGQIITRRLIENVPVENGCFIPNATYSKIAVFERHHQTGNKAVGIVKNFGITKGAIAQTIAHDSHNIICIGDSDSDMQLAINTLIEKQGGIVVVHNGRVLDYLVLPIAGLMSTLSASQLTKKLKDLLNCADLLKINPTMDPFLTLAFLALPVIPEVKMTDKGLFDVIQFKHIPVEA